MSPDMPVIKIRFTAMRVTPSSSRQPVTAIFPALPTTRVKSPAKSPRAVWPRPCSADPFAVDLYDSKSRIAEAFVESIFRRARYQVMPIRGAQALRIGHEDFSPTFGISSNGAAGPQFLVEAKYRPSVEQFTALENQRRDSSIYTLARKQWPNIVFVLVTDHPADGRSCFQVATDGNGSGRPQTTLDLCQLTDLRIFPHNVADHERLLLRCFGLLGA
jgi:hypothetical protein